MKLVNLYLINNTCSERDKKKEAGDVKSRDVPLSREGLKQAVILGKKHIAPMFEKMNLPEGSVRIYASTYYRVKLTVNSVIGSILDFMENAVIFDDKFNERSLGLMDGPLEESIREKHRNEIEAYQKELSLKGKIYTRPPQGEDINDVYERAENVKATLLSEQNPVEHIIIFAGGGFNRAIVKAFMNYDAAWYENGKYTDSGAIWHLYNDENNKWNDIGLLFAGFPN